MKFFVFNVLANIFFRILFDSYVSTENVSIEFLNDRLTDSQINDYLELHFKIKTISYFSIPFFLLIKTTLVATCLYMGAFFFSKVSFTFKKLWSIAVKAEYVFLLVGALKIVWFYFFQTTYSLEDLQYFYPLSGLNIIGYAGLEPWYIYPLQVLNLFEVAYWLVLGYFLGQLVFKDKAYPMQEGLKVVAMSYGPALLLWVALVMFLTLNYS